ncbi:MAG TPA: hypothetical protein VGH88_16170, partial [Streptosporangiaceae bacterium]
ELAGELVERLVRNAAAAGVASADWTELGALSPDEQAMLSEHVNDYSPAWLRLNELVAQRVQALAAGPLA